MSAVSIPSNLNSHIYFQDVEIQTKFKFCVNRKDKPVSLTRFPIDGKEIETFPYLPFNLFLFMGRGLLQSLCLLPAIFMMILSDSHANDRLWIYCSFALMITCMFIQWIILYLIEYKFSSGCGSTFSTTVAINTKNPQMAIELLWLNKKPSIVVGGKTLLSVATCSDYFRSTLVLSLIHI